MVPIIIKEIKTSKMMNNYIELILAYYWKLIYFIDYNFVN